MENKVERAGRRNSSIECLKIIAIVLIILSHVNQSLYYTNSSGILQDYVLNVYRPTKSIQHFILACLGGSGILGNNIFFVCSAWFWSENNSVNKKKMLQMMIDIWVISVTILAIVLFLGGKTLSFQMLVKQFLPTISANNWYLTCYLIFYAVHPFLNRIIETLTQREHLKIVLWMTMLYVMISFLLGGFFFFGSELIIWTTIYLILTYMKQYLREFSQNRKYNLYLVTVCVLGYVGIMFVTNLIGLRIGFDGSLLERWNIENNPFFIFLAIALFNLFRTSNFYVGWINFLSGLSLFVYLIHENMLLRTYYRPLIWQYVYHNYGYDYVVMWLIGIVLVIFIGSAVISMIFKITLHRFVIRITEWVYPFLECMYLKIEELILSFH